MDASKVPIGQKVIVTDTDYIKGTFARISEGKGVFEQFNPATGKLVLKVRIDMNSGASDTTYVDRDFWTITVDDKPIDSGAGIARGAMSFDAKARTINIKTK
jgi:hypothetical protein